MDNKRNLNMKKYLFMALACGLALTGCEDVPAPYEIFTDGDIHDGGTTGGTGKSLPYTSASLNADWNVVTVTGTPWSLGNTYAKATGYDNASKTTTPTESWLVSPAINVTTDARAAHITLDHVIRYVDKSSAPITNHTMWITSEFTGDVTTASWTQLDYHPVESANQSWDFYAADEVAIPEAFIGKTVYVAFKFVCGASSTTWELKNFNVLEGQAAAGTNPSPEPEPSVPVGDVKGNGTADDPYNVAGILTYTKGLGADKNSDKEVYFKGIVSSVKEISTKDNFNNATFYVSEDGKAANEFYVYRCLGLNKADILNSKLVEAGDEVVVCGKVVNFKGNTPETVQKEAYIVSIKKANGEVVTPDNPATPDPTPNTPGVDAQQISVADFLAKKDENTTYRLVGTVQNIVNTLYGNFDLVDATGKVYVYGLLNAAGEAKQFESLGVKVGDVLTIEGKYSEYNGSAQIKNAQYISHVAGQGGGNSEPSDNPATPDVSGDCITFDITANCFNIPSDKQTAAGTYTCGNYSITLTPAGADNSYYFNSKDKYVILGKQGATLEFNGFDFDVAKIEITGRSGASANTLQNIYVGNEAVSTQTKGAQGTNAYLIKEGYRAAGTHYVLKVESAHNTQFTEIKVYKVNQ